MVWEARSVYQDGLFIYPSLIYTLVYMTSNQIREKFLKFFEEKGHSIIPSASLIPENDNSVLFTTAGMQPLVPYLLGKQHPKGPRLASAQKCLRTGDIDDIGDNRHLTFFEMLGNWSLGDYFKEESIAWSFEFLTSKEKGLALDVSRLYVTCFEGDESAPRDEESKNIWMKAGIPENRIYFLGKEDNWWGPGENGPCGPDTEIFYDVTGKCGDLSQDDFLRAQKEEKVIEIWNNVFMEYESKDGKVIGKLAQKNVDTGMGLERITAVINGKDNVYDTDSFDYIFNLLPSGEEKSKRIIADHMRASCFLISDGVIPGNTDRAYILRRLLRGAIRHAKKLGLDSVADLVDSICEKYKEVYNLNSGNIKSVVLAEENKFLNTLEKGLKEFEKGERDAFLLFTSYGFPIEMTTELAREKGESIDLDLFNQKMKEHQDKSRAGGEQKFKGGLAGTSDAIVKLHTAHHLLLAALQKVLGPAVKQRGSNITEERLRIDFAFDRKMTDEEKAEVEKIVNEGIQKDFKVVKREMPKEEAEKIGAEMEFGAKYEDIVSVYFIEDENGNSISKEFCGGPHVEHTGALGKFKIQKEEASSSGVRRIKAVLL
ncbi:MAG: alanyl-tRNA synthetase [Patescibacteria group bacterium]|nr:alanyl-tRNA synthetase [Patescibacteria group bacterium]